MFFKILDLEAETYQIFADKSFCAIVGVSLRNFNNRWRCKKGKGIVIDNRWYISQIKVFGI